MLLRYARRLRRARRAHQGRDRGPRLRTFADSLARDDRIRRYYARRARALPPRPTSSGAHRPPYGPEISISLRACRRDPRLDDSRSENVPARSDRTRHAASIRLSSPLAAGRSRHVGQPHHDAPGSPVSTQRGSRRAPDDARRRRRGGDSRCWLLRLRSGPVCRTRIDNALSTERNS